VGSRLAILPIERYTTAKTVAFSDEKR